LGTKVEALRYDLTNIVWYDNKFIAIGSGSTPSIVVSGDGKTWLQEVQKMPLTSVTPLCITWNGEKLVAAGYDSTILTAVPKDIVKVKVNDRPIVFDVAPIIGEGRTLVPLRHIFEALGAEVKWDASTRTVTESKVRTRLY